MSVIVLFALTLGSYTSTGASSAPVAVVLAKTYYVSPDGSDTNPGTQAQPWQTIQKAVKTVVAGDTVLVRGGEYSTVYGGWSFQSSGTQSQPITISNYSGEQIIIKISQEDKNYGAFGCWYAPTDPEAWQTPKADFIRIIGSDVLPHVLSNGITSTKGIVIQGVLGHAAGVEAAGCDNWEVAGIDFVDVPYGIFTKKRNFMTTQDNSADHWYVHGNRVYGYFSESGMQFNGNYNLIENNEIYKVTDINNTPYGCQLLNLLGNNNIVRGNILSRKGSAVQCLGILLEWDLADGNTVEQNLIFDVTAGMVFQGGDNNVIRNNIIYISNTPEPYGAGIGIFSYDDLKTVWPCNEAAEAAAILPANNPSAPDYQYYYNPRNCHSFGNQVYNNTLHGFVEGIRLYPLVGENTIIRNNVFSGWTRGGICYYNASQGTCKPLPLGLVADYNAKQDFGYMDIQHFDFHLTADSPLIDAGYDLGSLDLDDHDGNSRPLGAGFDIGAYELVVPTSPIYLETLFLPYISQAGY